MLRRTITLILILLALAGPGLCCCTWTASIAPAKVAHHAGHSHRSGHRCCHHQSSGDKSKSSPQCPCRHHTAIQVVLLPSDIDHISELDRDCTVSFVGDLLLVLPVAAFEDLAAACLSAQALDNPFASAKGLLRALCVLRC